MSKDSALSRALARIDELEAELAAIPTVKECKDHLASNGLPIGLAARSARVLHQFITERMRSAGSPTPAVVRTERAQETLADYGLTDHRPALPNPKGDTFPPCDACHAPYGSHAAHCWREGVIR